jgi:SAM-dependent methyltransferase
VSSSDPFESFFRQQIYLQCKRSLYSFLRRKDEIARFTPTDNRALLEIGSGTAPVVSANKGTIYSDVSYEAMRYLRVVDRVPKVLVLSATEIPFADRSIKTVVCSEVIEHIDDDLTALKEIHRILADDGELILTVPIHSYYFAIDDRFVEHRRRYSVKGLLKLLRTIGFTSFTTSKVAGPLEKVTTIAAVITFRIASPFLSGKGESRMSSVVRRLLPIYETANRAFAEMIRWDAKIFPRFLTTIILVHCHKAK